MKEKRFLRGIALTVVLALFPSLFFAQARSISNSALKPKALPHTNDSITRTENRQLFITKGNSSVYGLILNNSRLSYKSDLEYCKNLLK